MIDGLSAAAVIYAIELTEGIRQLPPTAIVLRRFALGRWRVVRLADLGMAFRLVSWCLPLSVPLILDTEKPHSPLGMRRLLTRMRTRMRRTKRHLLVLRALGIATIVGAVIGLPIAVVKLGLFGLLASLLVLLVLALMQSIWTGCILRRSGMAPRSAIVASAKLLNPFAAPRAAEIILAHQVSGVPAVAVAFDLLGAVDLFRALRPAIYDLVERHEARYGFGCLTTLIGEESLSALLRKHPDEFEGSAFCPRCATAFASTVTHCTECDDLELVGPRPVSD